MEAVAAGAMEAAAAMSEQPPLAMSAPQHQLPQTAMSAPQHQLPQTAMSAPQQQVPLAMPPTAMSSSLPLAVAATVPVAGGAVLPMSTPVEAAIVQVQGGAVYQDAASTHPPPMTAEQALATAEAEALVLVEEGVVRSMSRARPADQAAEQPELPDENTRPPSSSNTPR